jgi:predicted transcriptional regulator
MEVHFPPETEQKLAHSAAQQGRAPDDLAQEIVTRYFEEEARFVEAVTRGEDSLRQGEFLTHEQVGERLQRFLRP